jgi:rfaE bifunctional protein kinase chain/domain/rfaE bifunctional protein nucleotidyltransferase chain/domain
MTDRTPQRKILTLDELLYRRASARADGRRVVHCHGCFDIVHPGHIRHLKFARAQGDILLVSITGDAGVNKGTGRPLIPQELRAENLAELDCVDWVCISPHATAVELLELVRPDIYIKGREYETNNDPRFKAERQSVEDHGGRVVFSSGDVVFSSTALIESLEASADPVHGRLAQLLGRDELTAPRMAAQVGSFRGKRVVVVGETIVDTYVFCDRPDVAGESPVLTLRPLEYRQYDGGAAVIARHCAAMGASPVLVTALPADERGEHLRRRLGAEGIEVRSIDAEAAMPEKQRFLVGTQKVMKLDLVDPIVVDAQRQDELVALAEAAAGERHTDAAIVADFGLGLLSRGVVRRLCRSLRPRAAILAGDVSGKRASLRELHEMDLLCPSEGELREAYRNFADGLPAVAWEMFQETGVGAAIVTMGPEGLIAFQKLAQAAQSDGAWVSRLRGEHVPALAAHAVDALGCGDALLATATLTLASGGTLLTAATLGSAAAAVQARRLGNPAVGAADLRKEIERLHGARLAFAPEAARAGGTIARTAS